MRGKINNINFEKINKLLIFAKLKHWASEHFSMNSNEPVVN